MSAASSGAAAEPASRNPGPPGKATNEVTSFKLQVSRCLEAAEPRSLELEGACADS